MQVLVGRGAPPPGSTAPPAPQRPLAAAPTAPAAGQGDKGQAPLLMGAAVGTNGAVYMLEQET